MVISLLIYLVLGVIWSAWLEWYTTTYLDGEEGSPWRMSERIVQILLWPYLLGYFLSEIYKNSRKN